MEFVGHVNAEGGPLILLDHAVATRWRGIEDGGGDYRRACQLLDRTPRVAGLPIPVGQGNGLLWDMGGPGTAMVYRHTQDHIEILRDWVDAPDGRAHTRQLAALALQAAEEVGTIVLLTEWLIVLWAPEDGLAFESFDSAGRANGEMAFETGGLAVRAVPGEYRVWHDKVSTENGSARRCHLVRAPAA